MISDFYDSPHPRPKIERPKPSPLAGRCDCSHPFNGDQYLPMHDECCSAFDTVPSLNLTKNELRRAGASINAGDDHDALWSLYDCLLSLISHLEDRDD